MFNAICLGGAIAFGTALSAQDAAAQVKPAQTIRIAPADANPMLQRVASIFERQLRKRCDARFITEGDADFTLELAITPGPGRQGFEISNAPGGVRITGGDGLGLLYGVGKFLRSGRYDRGGFMPGAWRGIDAPEKEFRAIYFATHFHNFYHDAPVEEIEQYVEELALWGYNAVIVWFDMHHFNGFADPEAQKMVKRLRSILGAAKRVGMGVGLTLLANEGYANSPAELRITPPTQIKIRGMYGVELCPSKPGAKEVVLHNFEAVFGAFSDIGLDYLSIWPYDQGGCGCAKCRPWGCNGFLMMAQPVAELGKRMFPGIRIVLSTWLFDPVENEGEWEGLARAFEKRPEWVDYILADSHTTFPSYLLKNPAPGGLPLVNFPEISMWGMGPWGGYGANPLPQRFQALWDSAGCKLSGGFPYSEGIFEDINKAVYSQFYWRSGKKASETLREYASYEYSPDAADDVLRMIEILEKNHTRPSQDSGSQAAFDLAQKVDAGLTRQARTAWRWRILYLRALLDREHYARPDQKSDEARKALAELVEIYHAQNAEPPVRPPL